MKDNKAVNRRKFLKNSFAGVVSTGLLANNSFLPKDNSQEKTEIKIREYRTLGRTGFKVSDIGFGAGSLSDPSILDRALKMGVNYIDTAEHYTGGNSETAIGQVIPRHDRNKLFITTKINISVVPGDKTREGLKSRFMKSLEKMKTDYADCLMIHMTPTVEEVTNEAFHEAYKELKSDGKVKFFGLSNHGTEHKMAGDTKDAMEKVVMAAADDGRFDVALFVYNFIQKEQGEKIIRKCREKKMGVTLMKTNPVIVLQRINQRAQNLEERIKAEKDENRKKQMQNFYNWFNPIVEDYGKRLERLEDFKKQYEIETNNEIRDAALKFTLNNPGVHSICPTPENFDDLNAFISLSGKRLTSTDSGTLSFYKNTMGKYYCRHACGECESACPSEVPVNTILRYNHYFEAQGREKHAMSKYARLSTMNAAKCLDCTGFCESECRYNVPVRSLLVNADHNLTL